MLKTIAAKLLGAKVLAVAAAATVATGGAALAAATNVLPDQAQSVAHDLLNAPAPSEHGDHNSEQVGKPAAKPGDAPKATPSPSLRGLCRAYQAGATSNHGKALTNPAFSALVSAAGGKDNLADYCTKLIGAPRTHPTGKPATRPDGKPSSHPTGEPHSGKPAALPTPDHPSGPPSTHPGKP
jgi:hypothetical protein